jgi:hypothetical protein
VPVARGQSDLRPIAIVLIRSSDGHRPHSVQLPYVVE